MPRKAAAATGEGASPDSAEPRRSTRIKDQPKPDPPAKAAAKPKSKKDDDEAAPKQGKKRAAADEDNEEEPAAKKVRCTLPLSFPASSDGGPAII